MSEFPNYYDLEERTAKFGEAVIKFCKTLNQDTISISIIKQLVRAATSVGANYMEANGASSKKDFRNKIFTCKKEAQETRHWLRMITQCAYGREKEISSLLQEAKELTLIFQKITSSLNLRKEEVASLKVEN